MILNNTPENIAVLSNVQSTTEFKIKSNYHSFRILSSGLYANKIRAIIRELSCNAVDSQVAAGNIETQFDVHLPTILEPFFSVRDYGTGLTHDQVVNIYTTYFESTKTGSNDFIGALGLGSKSPFSYTENFTVTAIKDGIKGIYSAFVNDQGVPAIARMADVETDEPNGVEVKFAVENGNDFSKFKQESETVFTYFPIKPNMIGARCLIKDVEYDEIDIIQNINVIKRNRYSYDNGSVAVMGNIAYPIEIPNADTNLGILSKLLEKDLEIKFSIGQLEFQASREGLSYTKETISAIKDKLQELQDKLDGILFAEADSIVNMWDRATYLVKKGNINIWTGSIKNYIAKTKFSLLDTSYHYIQYSEFWFTEEELANNYNIKISSFLSDSDRCSSIKPRSEYNSKHNGYVTGWKIPVSDKIYFVKSTKYRGALEQSKYHMKQNYAFNNCKIYVISKANNELPCDFDGFFAAIKNPPENRIISQDDLIEKPRADRKQTERNISILKLRTSRYDGETKWENVNNFNTLDQNKIYYYVPLRGYSPIAIEGYHIASVHDLIDEIIGSGINLLKDAVTIYGVRKADIDVVKTHKNWINIQEHLIDILPKTEIENIVGSYSYTNSKYKYAFNHNNISSLLINKNSKYGTFFKDYYEKKLTTFESTKYKSLLQTYAPSVLTKDLLIKSEQLYKDLQKTYPLLWCVDASTTTSQIAHYINLIDNQLNNSQTEKN